MAIETDLTERVLRMPAADRADLARQLILSLESEEPQVDVDPAWETEIERRLAAFDRGEVAPVDWRESVERARNSIRKNATP